jgi:hypothetical protein
MKTWRSCFKRKELNHRQWLMVRRTAIDIRSSDALTIAVANVCGDNGVVWLFRASWQVKVASHGRSNFFDDITVSEILRTSIFLWKTIHSQWGKVRVMDKDFQVSCFSVSRFMIQRKMLCRTRQALVVGFLMFPFLLLTEWRCSPRHAYI